MQTTKSSINIQQQLNELDFRTVNSTTSGMDLSRVDDKQPKDQRINNKSTSETSSRSSRSNSIEGLKIVDHEFNANATSSLNSNFVSLSNCVSSPYAVSNGQTPLTNTAAAYNVNQDFLLRMAMQNNSTSVALNSNANQFHNNKIYNDNLVAVAAAVANNNASHSLYQTALNNVTSTNNSNQLVNQSTISAAHHLVALNNPHNSSSINSAFQNLQQQAHSTTTTNQQLQNQIQSTSNQHLNHPTSNSNAADHLLSSITNGTLSSTNQSILAVTNGLINGNASAAASANNLNGLTSSNLSNTGSTNSSSNSSSNSLCNNSQMMLNEQLINQNLILASQSPFAPSTLIDSSTSNLFSGIKKRKRSPQPIPQDLKDDAYWDRRRRNNESAKRSREVRRIKEQSMHYRLAFLEKRNLQLTTELEMMKEEAKKMHDIIYCQRYGQDNQQDKHL